MFKKLTRFSIVSFVTLIVVGCSSITNDLFSSTELSNWPEAGGPEGNWRYTSNKSAPVHWSVSRNENILWKIDLPNVGQSGIAVWQDKLFLTTFAEGEGHNLPPKQRMSGKVLGLCIDKHTGEILWSVDLNGSVPSPMMYSFSDSTSPTPVTDGERVIFTNASGEMAAFDFSGKELWRRIFYPWTPKDKFPFNKQHEPILHGDVVLHVEPLNDHRSEKNKAYFGWNFIRGIDKYTGKTKWIAKDASTTYTTSVKGVTKDGRHAVLTGRGGPHGVPERPVGLSLISLEQDSAGETITRFLANTDMHGNVLEKPGTVGHPTWRALYNMHWNEDYTYMFKLLPKESVVKISTQTGEIIDEFQNSQSVDYRPWDIKLGKHGYYPNTNLHKTQDKSPRIKNIKHPDWALKQLQWAKKKNNVDLNKLGMTVYPASHSNITYKDYLYFLVGTAHTRNTPMTHQGLLAGPTHSMARLNITTGKVEFLELPSKLTPTGEYIYGEELISDTNNSKGFDVAKDPRTKSDGWSVASFWGSPTIVNGQLYYTTLGGLTYVIDANAAVLDASALLSVNDLGEVGKTWSANSVSFSDGVLFHRSAKHLVAIKE